MLTKGRNLPVEIYSSDECLRDIPRLTRVIDFVILVEAVVALLLVISFVTISNQLALGAQQNCTRGWYVTGYFIPVEGNYNGSKQIVKVIAPNSAVQNRTFYKSFLHEVRVEGWGKTVAGDYIGLVTNDRQWHSASNPTGAGGEPLMRNTVAVDPNIIKLGKKLIIPTLPGPWNTTTLNAADVGPGIKGKHVDVYTGGGKNAGEETRRITGHDNQLCLM
jgi:3D (Asp-Asp-Asp) domain-containing protein